jgi:hypothetical protein
MFTLNSHLSILRNLGVHQLATYLSYSCLLYHNYLVCLLLHVCYMFALFAHVLASLHCVLTSTWLLHVGPFTIGIPKNECLTEIKIIKINFGFFFVLHYYNYNGLLYANR